MAACSRNRQSHLREDERAHSWVVIGSGAARLLMTGPEVDKTSTVTISEVSPCKQDRRSVRSARGVEEQRQVGLSPSTHRITSPFSGLVSVWTCFWRFRQR